MIQDKVIQLLEEGYSRVENVFELQEMCGEVTIEEADYIAAYLEDADLLIRLNGYGWFLAPISDEEFYALVGAALSDEEAA